MNWKLSNSAHVKATLLGLDFLAPSAAGFGVAAAAAVANSFA
jgi:hypothetical protein